MPVAGKNKYSGVIGGVLAGFLMLGLIVYTLYHGFSSFAGGVTTAAVTVSDTRTVATGQACVIREEKVVLADTGGVIEPLVENGARVSADAPLARVYAMTAEDAAALYAELEEADRQIALLQASVEGGKLSTAHADELQNEIYSACAGMIGTVRRGEYAAVKDATDGMLLSLNRYGVLTGKENFGALLAAWQAKREALLRDYGSGALLGSKEYGSGFFYHRSTVDGYEALLSPSGLSGLTSEKLAGILAVPETVSSRTAGKMVYGYTWYLALPAPLDVAAAVSAGETYEITFSAQGVTLPMTLEAINVSRLNDDALLIFSCTRMPAGFSYDRVQSVEILLNTYSGFRIPENALATCEGQTGVFVLDGSIVYFKRIAITNLGDGYVLAAKTDPDPDAPGAYLSANDLLILSGENLYDGKILS